MPGESFTDLQSSRTPAHMRLIFEELFFIELGARTKAPGTEGADRNRLPDSTSGFAQAIKKILPFHPTAAQKRVLKEIATDMQTALSHAASAARRCGFGQDDRGLRSGHHRHRKRLPGRVHGAHGNSGAAALFLRAADSGESRISHRAADRFARSRIASARFAATLRTEMRSW